MSDALYVAPNATLPPGVAPTAAMPPMLPPLPAGIAPVSPTIDPALAEKFISTHLPANRDLLRMHYNASRAAPPPPPPAPPTPAPTGWASDDVMLAAARGSVSASAEAMGQIIAKSLALVPDAPEFTPPANGRYDIAFTGSDPTEMNTQFLKMELPQTAGRAMSRAFLDSAAEVSAMPSYQAYQKATADLANGAVDQTEFANRTAPWSNYVAETRKTVENVTHRPYADVVAVAKLAVDRLDPAVAKRWAARGSFEQPGVMVALFKQGLLLQAKQRR